MQIQAIHFQPIRRHLLFWKKGLMSLSTSTCEWHGIWSYIPGRQRRISEIWYLGVSLLRDQEAHFFAWCSVFLAGKRGRLNYMCFKIIACFGILVICNSDVFPHFVLHLLISSSISVLALTLMCSHYPLVIRSVNLAAFQCKFGDF